MAILRSNVFEPDPKRSFTTNLKLFDIFLLRVGENVRIPVTSYPTHLKRRNQLAPGVGPQHGVRNVGDHV